MMSESIEKLGERTEAIRELALAAGFACARFLVPFDPREADGRAPPPGYADGAPALLVVALTYGNDDPDGRPGAVSPAEPDATRPELAAPARIAAFARRNYYAEAVARLKTVAAELRNRYGGVKSDYRILCNSPISEKPLAASCGLGSIGRNSLVITREAGSLVVLAAMTLPFDVLPDRPAEDACVPSEKGGTEASRSGPRICGGCSACVEACPTGALPGDGTLDRFRCIAWYASGHGDPPPEVATVWENRLYGCTVCQDICPYNRRPFPGVATDRGALPTELDAAELLALSDDELRELFRGTAMGMAWLGPEAIRRNAERAMRHKRNRGDIE